jgi:hypothetical protein
VQARSGLSLNHRLVVARNPSNVHCRPRRPTCKSLFRRRRNKTAMPIRLAQINGCLNWRSSTA